MKRLLSLLLCLCLGGCALNGVRYTHYAPTQPFEVLAPAYLHALPDTTLPVSFYLYPHGTVQVVGVLNREWVVIRYEGSRFFVRNELLGQRQGGGHGYYNGYGGGYGGLALPRDTYIGPRGGEYYYNGNGNKQYVTPPATQYRQDVQYGPRGGQFYYNGSGRKTYLKQ